MLVGILRAAALALVMSDEAMSLRVRHGSGVLRLTLPAATTLRALRAKVEDSLAVPIASLSARIASRGETLQFISGGQWAHQTAALGPGAPLNAVGLRTHDILHCTTGPAPPESGSASAASAGGAGRGETNVVSLIDSDDDGDVGDGPPPGIDASVWKELPAEIREELRRGPGGPPAAAGAATGGRRYPAPEGLSFMSYNVWFAEEVALQERMAEIGRIIRDRLPTVLALQEVTPAILTLLRPHLQACGYGAIEPQPTYHRGAPYFTLLASRIPFVHTSYHPFESSQMGRGLQIAEFLVSPELFRAQHGADELQALLPEPRRFCVATAHLESPCPPHNFYSGQRKAQAAAAFRALAERKSASGSEGVVFMGDLNWTERRDGALPLPTKWADAWLDLHGGDPGYTYDAKANGMLLGSLRLRLDRVLCWSKFAAPSACAKVGAEPVATAATYTKRTRSGDRQLPVFPSDHFGLLVHFRLRSRGTAPAAPEEGAAAKAPAAQPSIASIFKRKAPAGGDAPAAKRSRAGDGARRCRGVALPGAWGCVGGSLLVLNHASFRNAHGRTAAFDFDNCVAETDVADHRPEQWSMKYAAVPETMRRLHDAGYNIVVISNESLARFKKEDAIRKHIVKKTTRVQRWCEACGDVPILALVATAKDGYRKPATDAFAYAAAYADGSSGSPPSFFVGDAAGRPGDFADTDLQFANNAGLRFYTETHFFEGGGAEEAIAAGPGGAAPPGRDGVLRT